MTYKTGGSVRGGAKKKKRGKKQEEVTLQVSAGKVLLYAKREGWLRIGKESQEGTSMPGTSSIPRKGTLGEGNAKGSRRRRGIQGGSGMRKQGWFRVKGDRKVVLQVETPWHHAKDQLAKESGPSRGPQGSTKQGKEISLPERDTGPFDKGMGSERKEKLPPVVGGKERAGKEREPTGKIFI